MFILIFFVNGFLAHREAPLEADRDRVKAKNEDLALKGFVSMVAVRSCSNFVGRVIVAVAAVVDSSRQQGKVMYIVGGELRLSVVIHAETTAAPAK